MENYQYQELLEMREQLALLKQKLDNEAIVNDHLLREVTRQKVRRLNRNVWQEGVSCLLVFTFGTYAFRDMGLSWWFVGATMIMMVACFFATLIPHRRIKTDEIMSGDLLTVAKQVRRLKYVYQEWIKIGIPMIIVWVGWFAYEVCLSPDHWKLKMGMLVGCVVGALTGGLIGWHQHKKLLREMDDLIQDIEN